MFSKKIYLTPLIVLNIILKVQIVELINTRTNSYFNIIWLETIIFIGIPRLLFFFQPNTLI